MSKQQQPLVGYSGYTPEELHAIVQRAHRERTQAIDAFFSRLFARRKAAAQVAKQPAGRLRLTPAE